MVDAFSARGFTLNNGMKVVGPMVIFPNAVLSWRVQVFTMKNLLVFTKLIIIRLRKLDVGVS